jgi:chemotaxis protein MotD
MADASQDPSAADTQAAEATSADSAVASPEAPDCAADATELVDALTAALGTGDNASVTPPAPPATVVPVSVEVVLVAQGDAATAAEGAAPKIPLPAPPAPNPGNQANAPGETAQAQPIEANESAAPFAELVNAATGKDQTAAPPDTGELVADAAPQDGQPLPPPTPTKARGTNAQGAQVAQTAQAAKDAEGAEAAVAPAAAATDAGKPRPHPGTPPVETAEPNATASAAETDQPVDSAEPEPTGRPVGDPHCPHQHADAAKSDDQQPLGLQVSDAARNAKAPSEAVHAVLQTHDRGAAGTTAAPASAQAAAAATAGPDAAIPIAGLAVEIAARAQAGSNRFEIRLDPPELGRIDVRLDIDRSGQVTSRLVVERVETLEHLRRDAADLERALQQAGLKTTQDGLQFSLRDQGFAGRDDNSSSPNVARLVVPDPDLAPVDALVAGYGRMARTGGIDIRV